MKETFARKRSNPKRLHSQFKNLWTSWRYSPVMTSKIFKTGREAKNWAEEDARGAPGSKILTTLGASLVPKFLKGIHDA